MSFFGELKRRHVFRVGIAYVVMGWLLLQIADVLFNNLDLPGWAFNLVFALLVICFPIVVMLAWAYDLTPRGLVRTEDTVEGETPEEAAPAPVETPAASTPPASASVAVLPFVNMSGAQENEYFSDGLSEELLNVLANINELKVAARTSSFQYKGQTGNVAEIARDLGVASVLEGSVRQAGNRVRITAQLINAADGYHLWSQTYDRELDDIFAVQDDIASSVADALKVRLLGDEADQLKIGGTHDTAAFQAYLQGVHYRNRGSDKEALLKAVEEFQRAIELDPEYAQAHAGLASAWEQLATNNFASLDNLAARVSEPAKRSIELAPGLADGHEVLSRLRLFYELDEAGAREAIATAMKLNPGSASVQFAYAQICSLYGDHEGAVAAARKAVELDPVSLSANHFLGHVLYFARRYDEAIEVFRHVLELDPNFPRPRYTLGMCRFMQGDTEAALECVEREPLDWMRFSGLAIILQSLGRTAEAEANLASLIEDYRDNGLYQQTQVHAQWGDLDQALKDLNRAREIGDPGTSQVLVDPLLDPLRAEPGFAALLGKTGFESRA